MGQAKQRGTFEQRKAEAKERNRIERIMGESQLPRRVPSTKTVAMLGMIAAMAGGTFANVPMTGNQKDGPA